MKFLILHCNLLYLLMSIQFTLCHITKYFDSTQYKSYQSEDIFNILIKIIRYISASYWSEITGWRTQSKLTIYAYACRYVKKKPHLFLVHTEQFKHPWIPHPTKHSPPPTHPQSPTLNAVMQTVSKYIFVRLGLAHKYKRTIQRYAN